MYRLFGGIYRLTNRSYLERVPFRPDCWQALELRGVAVFGFCPCSRWVIKIYRALLDFTLELDSIFEKFVSVQAGLAIILVLRVVYLLLAGGLPEKRRAFVEFLVLTYEGLLHLWDPPLSCLAVEISIYYALPSNFMLGKGNGPH